MPSCGVGGGCRVGGRVVVCLWCVCGPSPAALQGGPYRVAAEAPPQLCCSMQQVRATSSALI
eukprot:COSAG02_NODE_59581_length_274_cov_0.554286_1_plen_61_part_01